MKYTAALLFLFLLFSPPTLAFSDESKTTQAKESAPMTEYLIRFNEEVEERDRKEILNKLHLKEVERVTKSTPLFLAKTTQAISFEELKRNASLEKRIRYIEPNMQYAVPTPVTEEK